jgi:predicted O-methyltransferase YrrM
LRTFKHWTPRYVLARSREALDHKTRPADPWLTREAIGLLDRLLRPTDVAVEFGSGRSTAWFASRVAKLTSVEDNAEWFAIVAAKLRAAGQGNVDYLHRPRDVPDDDGANAAYVRVLDGIADESLDFVLVDGIYRNHCAVRAVAKVKRGGMIAIDNVNWFLPSGTRSPTSRGLNDPPVDAVWRTFADQTRDWRRIWTSSGVTDTLIVFKS